MDEKTIVYKIKNLGQLEKLVEKAEQQNELLKSTIDELKNFEVELEKVKLNDN